MCWVEESVSDVNLCFDFFHSFPRILDVLYFSFTISSATITLGSLAFTSALLSASLA